MIDNSYKTDVFGSYIQEDVLFCHNDIQGGMAECEIYFCYQPFILSMSTPRVIAPNHDAGNIQKVLCQEGRGFNKIQAMIESVSITTEYSSKRDASQFSAFILGNRAHLIGLSRKIRERPFTLIVRDNNNKLFLIGTLASPAYLKNFKIESGKKFDDNCGADIQFSSNAIFYEFTGQIPIIDPTAGDFNTDFDEDFD